MKFKTDKKDRAWKIKLERLRKSKLWAADMSIIAIRILDHLEDTRKTQRWLADQLGVTPQQVTKIVKGRQNMSWGKIKELENVLGISLANISSRRCDAQRVYTPMNETMTRYTHKVLSDHDEAHTVVNKPIGKVIRLKGDPVYFTPNRKVVMC